MQRRIHLRGSGGEASPGLRVVQSSTALAEECAFIQRLRGWDRAPWNCQASYEPNECLRMHGLPQEQTV